MSELSCKVLVIGGGPGGYVASIRAGQLGLDVVLIEEDRLGGVCLNVGCIPSKALIHAADAYHAVASGRALAAIGVSVGAARLDFAKTQAWKQGLVDRLTGGVAALLRKAGARVIKGQAELIDGKTARAITPNGVETVRCEHLVLATGSAPAALDALPFGPDVLSSSDALALQALPASLAVIGGGYIGVELGTAFAKMGVQVTLVEALDRLLPLYDRELVAPVLARLAELGVAVHLGARVTGFVGGALTLQDADGVERSLPVEKVLVAVGRRPRTRGFGLEKLDLAMDGAFVRTDDRRRTSMRGVWAIGDLTGGPMLAHKAMAEGEMVAEIIAGRPRRWDKAVIPAVTFSDPEILSAGLSPDKARQAGIEVRVGTYPFRANGRAMTKQDESGFVRVVARSKDDVVLGMQAVGAGVCEFASGFALALEMGARLEDVAATIHAHPTQSEAIAESALAALGRSLHI